MLKARLSYYFGFLALCGLIYTATFLYEKQVESEVYKSQKFARSIAIELGKELQLKSGAVVNSNKADPLLHRTLLRLLIGLPEGELLQYEYRDMLKVTLAGEETLILPSDLINFIPLTQAGNTLTFHLE